MSEKTKEPLLSKIKNLKIYKIYSFLSNELDEKKYKVLILYFMILSITECLAYILGSVFSVIALRMWIITGIFFVFSVLCSFISALKQDIYEKKYFSIIFLSILLILLCSIMGNVSIADINPDAAQQAAAGLDSFKSPDFNYTGKAFLGYPARQYIISALPAVLFGRSITTLHMGFGIPFILGILMMYCGIRTWIKSRNLNTNLAVIPLYAILVFPYAAEYYANFEQAIYPISFSMLTIGFFLLLLHKTNIINTISIAWIGGLLGTSYTPSIAMLGLLVVFLLLCSYLWIKKPEFMPFPSKNPVLSAKAAWLIAGNICVFFALTFLLERQDRMNIFKDDQSIFSILIESIFNFLEDKKTVFLGVFHLITLIYFILSLTFQLKFYDFLLTLWIFGVVFFSNIMTGYAQYSYQWMQQRVMIIIPVLITAFTLLFSNLLKKYQIKIKDKIIVSFCFLFLFLGVYNFKQPNQSFVYFHHTQPIKYLLSDLENITKENKLDSMSEFNIVLYTNNTLIKNLKDYTCFFYPNAHIYVPETEQLPEEMNHNLISFVYREEDIRNLHQTVFENQLIFQNKKYNLIIVWYRSILEKYQ